MAAAALLVAITALVLILLVMWRSWDLFVSRQDFDAHRRYMDSYASGIALEVARATADGTAQIEGLRERIELIARTAQEADETLAGGIDAAHVAAYELSQQMQQRRRSAKQNKVRRKA